MLFPFIFLESNTGETVCVIYIISQAISNTENRQSFKQAALAVSNVTSRDKVPVRDCSAQLNAPWLFLL